MTGNSYWLLGALALLGLMFLRAMGVAQRKRANQRLREEVERFKSMYVTERKQNQRLGEEIERLRKEGADRPR